MVYRKTYKRKTYKKKTMAQRGYVKPSIMQSTNYLANKAFEGVKFLKGIINSELHKRDFVQGGFNIPNSTQPVQLLNGLSQGDTVSTRTGNSLLMKHISIRGYINFDTLGSSNSTIVKYWVVVDQQQIGDTNPVFSDIFSNNDVLSLLNSSTVGRFKILKTGLCIRDLNVNQKQVNIDIPLNMHTRFNGTASTDIQKNGIYLCWTSNQSTALPTASYLTRISYYDN